MTIMFSNFMENVNWQIQNTNRTPRRKYTKKTILRHFVVK